MRITLSTEFMKAGGSRDVLKEQTKNGLTLWTSVDGHYYGILSVNLTVSSIAFRGIIKNC